MSHADTELRLECLKLAASHGSLHDIEKRADSFYSFVMNGSLEAPAQLQKLPSDNPPA